MGGLENSLVFHGICLFLSFITAYLLGRWLYGLFRPYPVPETVLLRQEQELERDQKNKVHSGRASQTYVAGYYVGGVTRPAGIMRDMVL